ncbi:MAG: pentapeptide repeat-containing protein [Myxococcales bacterium FL481]|nr:MAG: pentapeptide repeat-containing protein [Myxococcales bacterium FL481]
MNTKDLLEKYNNGDRDFRGANLYGAYLLGVDLRGADLRGADLRGTNFYCANLCGADLGGADLYCANLCGADLGGADLYCSNLSGANLSGANLRGTNLSGADLRYAKLYGAQTEFGTWKVEPPRISLIKYSALWLSPNHIKIGRTTLTVNEWLGGPGDELFKEHEPGGHPDIAVLRMWVQQLQAPEYDFAFDFNKQ